MRDSVYIHRPHRHFLAMLILLLYCGFYLSGLIISRWLTTDRQALISGLATSSAACVGGLTLWLIALAGFVEPWLSIAMAGTVALPALMIGAGFLAGWWLRRSGYATGALAIAGLFPAGLLLFAAFE